MTCADEDPSDFDNLFKRTMPWLGDDVCMKGPQALPGLSLVQWMNMQQNPVLSSSLQPNYMQSLSGSVLQNLPGADIARQLGFCAPQISQSSNVAFNPQRLLQTPQVDHLQKIPSASSSLGPVMQPPQQLGDVTQQPRQNIGNQILPQSQVQSQLLHAQNIVQPNNILQQQQPSIQNHHLHGNLSQNLSQPQQQQTVMGQSQQQNLIQPSMPDHGNQQLQMSDNQIQFQLLQKLQQQQQTLLAQQSVLQQSTQLSQIQGQQRQLLDPTQNFSKALTSSQVLEIPSILQNSLPDSNSIPPQMMKNNGQTNNAQFSHPTQLAKPQQQQPGTLSEMSGHVGLPPAPTANKLSAAGSSILTGAAGAGQSVITDDIPSCSTSPSTNNCANTLPRMNSRIHRNTMIGDDMAQSAATILSPSALETMSSNASLVKDFQPKSEVKPSLNVSKSQNQGNFSAHVYFNGGAAQTDYLDTSSSTTSVSLSRNDTYMHQNNNPFSYNPQSMLFTDNNQDGEIQLDASSNVPFGNNIDGQLGMPLNPDSLLTKGTIGLGKDLSNNFSSGGMVGNYEDNRDAQQELSSSIVSQSFGVPAMTFNSIDPTINDSSFLNRGTWAPPPPPPPQRMRTYTKVSLLLLLLLFIELCLS